MRKSTLFISAALTAFILVILAGAVSSYQNIAGTLTGLEAQPTQASEMAQVIAPTAVPVPTQIPLPTQPATITPEQATEIASKVMGKTDLYSVEIAQLEGVDAYLVTFSSGDLVYVGLDGQVLSISKLPVTVVTLPNTGGGGGGNTRNSEEHESSEHEDEEHEGDDD